MKAKKLVKGKKYKPIHRDFVTQKIVKSRKYWTYGGNIKGGIINANYLLFYTDRTQKLIPEYLFEGVM